MGINAHIATVLTIEAPKPQKIQHISALAEAGVFGITEFSKFQLQQTRKSRAILFKAKHKPNEIIAGSNAR